MAGKEMSFWDHLEELRWCLLRSIVVFLVSYVVLFFFKGFVFDTLVLGPVKSDFWLYRLLGIAFSLNFINTEVTAQFFIHLRVTFIAALVCTFPYLCFELWRFVSPALYKEEKRAVRGAFGLGACLFYSGVAMGYFIVIPLVMYFFSGYQVSASVQNVFTIDSYIGIFSSMVLLMGISFEFPVVLALLSRIGIVTRELLRKYRRHAIMIILILSAIITPTGDPFTMLVVALPLYLLFEASILMCRPQS